jgi:hypothetical protein
VQPFDSYPGAGRVPIGLLHSGDGTARRGYGLDLVRRTGQSRCAYCGLALFDSYAHWLLLSVDHVVPSGDARRLGIGPALVNDLINLVLCCSGCNGFGNRYSVPSNLVPLGTVWTSERFVALRDGIFRDRAQRIAARRATELAYFQSQPWAAVAART